jgi:hypothetical protein
LTLQKALGRCSQQGAHNVSRIGLADVAPWVRICDPFILVINILINIVINIAKSLGMNSLEEESPMQTENLEPWVCDSSQHELVAAIGANRGQALVDTVSASW